ncbi:MAG: hypothetical protein J5374_05435 [Bacteroidales bacterium]|jgi:hypothetical protein|nr:hypothetical protein [Bacteroidales bacterium]
MIKCNATVVGTVNRPVEIRSGRGDKAFVTFGLAVVVKDGDESVKLDVSVACDGENDEVLDLIPGERVKVKGVMTFKRFGDTLYYNLSAEKVSGNAKKEDSITGTLRFKGTLGSKEVFERTGRKGGFRAFDAYSSEKIDEDQYSYVWVHFIDFGKERPDWLGPRAGIEAEGKLELQVYNEAVSLGCRVETLTQWVKQTASK